MQIRMYITNLDPDIKILDDMYSYMLNQYFDRKNLNKIKNKYNIVNIY